MADKAQDHNRKMEEAIIRASIWEARAGMILGASVLLILIGLAVWAGMSGNNILAGMLLTSGMLSGAAALIWGNHNGRS